MDEHVGISYNYLTDRNWYSIRKNHRDDIFPGVCSACVTTYCVENNIVTEYRRFMLADMYIDRSSFTTSVQFECTWRELIK